MSTTTHFHKAWTNKGGHVIPVQRYEWENPDDLIHIDVNSLARFRKVGCGITGDCQQGRSCGVG